MFKILDKINGEVTAEQQAVFNKISTNNADGYVDGFLNNLRIAKMSSNVISIDSGLLSIQGFRSVNTKTETYTVSVTPSEPIPFQLVATYSHYISSENDTLEITTRPTQELRREPLFSGQNAVYEVELAEFNMTADGIADFVVTLEKIVYNEQDLTELLDKVTKAEADSATAKTTAEKASADVAELAKQIGEKQGTAVYVGGTAQNRVDFDSDPQAQIDNIAASYAQTNGIYPSLKAGGNVFVDTRSVNSPPSYYQNKQTCYEFKSPSVIGLSNIMPDSSFVGVTTKKAWEGSYVVYQEAVSAGNDLNSVKASVKAYRYGLDESWGNWKTFMAIDPTKLVPSTENGWSVSQNPKLVDKGVYAVSVDCTTDYVGIVDKSSIGFLFYDGASFGTCSAYVVTSANGVISGSKTTEAPLKYKYSSDGTYSWTYSSRTINNILYKRIG